jgi:hypothetical protein
MTKQEFMGFSLDKGLKFIEPEIKINGRLVFPQRILIINCYNFHSIIKNNKILILRPLSDITKEIEHNGEVFIPIVELAKICFNNTFTTLPHIITFEVLNSGNDESFGFIGFTSDERFSLTFDNTFNNQSFEFWIGGSEHHIKQFDLFQKLIEWHFAVGLSEDDYIDVNSLEVNPYK